MSVAPSRNAAHSQVAPSRAAPSGSLASAHLHRSARSHLSFAREDANVSNSAAKSVVFNKAPTVVPSDSVSQIGDRIPPSQTSHASRNESLHPSHHSQVSHACSQRLTEANLHVHEVETRSSHHSAAPVQYEVEVVEERASRASRHSGAGAPSHQTSYRAPIVTTASGAPSHRTPTVVLTKVGPRATSQSGSKAPSAVPSHARSASHSPSSRSRTIVASQVQSAAPTSVPVQEAAPPLKASTAAPSKVGSAAPPKATSHAEIAAHSQVGSKAPTSVPTDHRSTAPTSPTSPKAPTTSGASPPSPPLSVKSERSGEHSQTHSRSDSDDALGTNSVNVVEVKRADDQLIETEYKVQRRHVYPIKA